MNAGDRFRRETKLGTSHRKGMLSLSDNSQRIGKPEIDLVASKNGTLVRLSGRIDIEFSPVLRNKLHSALQAPYPKKVSIDLSAATHIDSSGIATLIEALKIARGHNIELSLQGLQPGLLHLLESAGILALFDGATGRATHVGREAK